MKPSERRCDDKHDAKPLWILICGELGCGVNILADEFEGSEYIAQLEDENEELQDKERRAWEYARFFSGRSELLRLHIRTHLGLSHKDCIGWGEHDYRDALLTGDTDD